MTNKIAKLTRPEYAAPLRPVYFTLLAMAIAISAAAGAAVGAIKLADMIYPLPDLQPTVEQRITKLHSNKNECIAVGDDDRFVVTTTTNACWVDYQYEWATKPICYRTTLDNRDSVREYGGTQVDLYMTDLEPHQLYVITCKNRR